MDFLITLFFTFIFLYIINYMYFNYKSSAIEIVNDMGLGYNFGNVLTFNCSCNFEELNGTIFPTKYNIRNIKKYGFKTIRFQMIYLDIINDTDKLNSEWISKVRELITYTTNENMYCILSILHDAEFWRIEGKNGKDKYINLWNQIANELMNYDEHLIFESNNDVNYDSFYTYDEEIEIEVDDDYINYDNDDYEEFIDEDDYYNDYNNQDSPITLLETTQSFINTIRNTGGLNKERLLIISGLNNEFELTNVFTYEMPIDPFNKSAISLHYYIPIDEHYEYNEEIKMNFYDNDNNYYETYPKKEWGSINDYKNILEKFNLLKKIFTDKGIPVIITEVGMMTEQRKENDFMIEFLYVLFSFTQEYDGIMSCLWDISEQIGEDIYYYNKEENKWKDKKIMDNLYKISKLNYVQISEFYIKTNLITEARSTYNTLFLNLEKRKALKVLLNIKIKGYLGIDGSLFCMCGDSKNEWSEILIEKEDGKKQYDGTTLFNIDVSRFDCYNYIEVKIFFGEEYITLNNLTVEFEENFISLDYKSYKSAVLLDINND